MQIPILVEPMAGGGFRARSSEPLAFTAEGTTREEAVREVRRLIEAYLAQGAEIIPVEVPALDNPWKRIEGMYKDDPHFDEFRQAMAEYRCQVEEDPNCL